MLNKYRNKQTDEAHCSIRIEKNSSRIADKVHTNSCRIHMFIDGNTTKLLVVTSECL